MGLLDKLRNNASRDAQEDAGPAPLSVLLDAGCAIVPTSGRVMPLSEVPDPVLADGAMGQGLGVAPTDGIVYAPMSGLIATIGAPNYHAVMLAADNGAEILIHVGVDTVELRGRGFDVLASKGDHVPAGTPLLAFDSSAIRAAGYDDTVIMCVANTKDFESVELVCEGEAKAGDTGLKIS